MIQRRTNNRLLKQFLKLENSIEIYQQEIMPVNFEQKDFEEEDMSILAFSCILVLLKFERKRRNYSFRSPRQIKTFLWVRKVKKLG